MFFLKRKQNQHGLFAHYQTRMRTSKEQQRYLHHTQLNTAFVYSHLFLNSMISNFNRIPVEPHASAFNSAPTPSLVWHAICIEGCLTASPRAHAFVNNDMLSCQNRKSFSSCIEFLQKLPDWFPRILEIVCRK